MDRNFTLKDGLEPVTENEVRGIPETTTEETTTASTDTEEKKEETSKEETPKDEKTSEDTKSEKETEDSESKEDKEETTKDDTTHTEESEKGSEDDEESSLQDETQEVEEVEESFTTFSEWEEGYNSSLEEGQPTIADMMAIKYENIEAMDETTLIIQAMLVEDEGMPDSEIDAAMEEFEPLFWSDDQREQELEDGNITERDLRVLDAKFSKLKRSSINTLKDIQNSVSLDSINMFTNNAETQDNTVQQEQLDALVNAVNDHMSTYDNETLKVTDKDGKEIFAMDYEISKDSKGQVSQLAGNPQGISERWINEDGTMNMGKYVSDLVWLNNRNEILRATINQAKSEGGSDVAKDISEIDHSTKKSTTSGETDAFKSPHDNLREMNS